jgi:hypothetical protein
MHLSGGATSRTPRDRAPSRATPFGNYPCALKNDTPANCPLCSTNHEQKQTAANTTWPPGIRQTGCGASSAHQRPERIRRTGRGAPVQGWEFLRVPYRGHLCAFSSFRPINAAIHSGRRLCTPGTAVIVMARPERQVHRITFWGLSRRPAPGGWRCGVAGARPRDPFVRVRWWSGNPG